MQFIKKEWVGAKSGDLYDTRVISKEAAISLIEKNGHSGHGEQLLEDLIQQWKADESVSITYLIRSGLEVGIAS